jgi:hypothetical protein
MFNRISRPCAVVCLGLLGVVWAAVASGQIPEKAEKPMQVPLKRAGAAAGPLSAVTAALEIQAQQPNVPAGLRGTLVITNGGTTAIELMDPAGTSQLEVRTAAGRVLRPAPMAAMGPTHVHGAKPAEPVRLAPKESRRIDIGVSEVAVDETAAPSTTPAAAPPGTPKPTSAPLMSGRYSVRAQVRLVPSQAPDAKSSAAFESGWVEVVLGMK